MIKILKLTPLKFSSGHGTQLNSRRSNSLNEGRIAVRYHRPAFFGAITKEHDPMSIQQFFETFFINYFGFNTLNNGTIGICNRAINLHSSRINHWA